ncbi:MAG: DUF2961 domain-containing protein [Planctomycetes bacterium]|nr:DUF2961 domain-containing protein [Planctomycetota bacterium]
MPFEDLLSGLERPGNVRTMRASSWDMTGKNSDAWMIGAGEERVLADIEGPGRITHIWMTQSCRRMAGANWFVPDPDVYRKVLLAFYWDGEKEPSVLAPLGDFFCMGHSIAGNFQSLPFTVSVNAQSNMKFGAPAALNCYLPMPFRKRAKVVIINENDIGYVQYFYIDYEKVLDGLPDETAYLHAQWRRENPCPGWAPEMRVNTPPVDIPNDGAKNYVILEAKGSGHYVGCNLSVTNFQGTWWGEGDDMIFVDGEEFPPAIHGTGSEDFLNQAYGMQPNAYLMNGSSKYEHEGPAGYQVSYNFYLTNPVRFRKGIRVTLEHGHGNHLANEWSSTAYWYQQEPHKAFGILPVAKRLPVRHADLGVAPILEPPGWKEPRLTPEQKRIKEKYRKELDRAGKAHAAGQKRAAKAQKKLEKEGSPLGRKKRRKR